MVCRACGVRGPGGREIKVMCFKQVPELSAVVVFMFRFIGADMGIVRVWRGIRGGVVAWVKAATGTDVSVGIGEDNIQGRLC